MRTVMLLAVMLASVCLCVSASTATAPRAAPDDASWWSFCVQNGKLVPTSGIHDACNVFGYFDDKVDTTGWSYLHVEANLTLGNDDQAYGIGFAEGYMSATRIQQSLVNSLAATFPGGVVPANVYAWIATQQQYVAASASQNKGDWYWEQVTFVYTQVQGIVDGCAAAGFKISVADLLVLNMIAEVGDIQAAIDPHYRAAMDVLNMNDIKSVKHVMEKHSHCSALIRLAPDGSDMFSTHTTWTGYAQMLRTYKYYKASPLGSQATGVQFSSYPGCVSSIDDYYQLSSGLVVIETTNNVANVSLYDLVTSSSVPTFVRVMVSNRMAAGGEQWGRIMEVQNSGTYNNQWMIVDNNQFTPHHPLGPDVLWIASQRPGKFYRRDVTDVLVKKGYWPSFNIPYFQELWNELGYASLVKQYGSMGAYLWQYEGSFRDVLFARDAPKVKDIQDMQAIIQENNWQTDPLSKNCAELAIAARMDLSAGPLGTEDAQGAIDAKLTAATWMREEGPMQVLAKSGPTVETQVPFVWSTSKWNSQPHEGMPDKFDFPWQTFSVQPKPHAHNAQQQTQKIVPKHSVEGGIATE